MSLMKSSFPLTVYRAKSSTLASITSDRIRQFAFRSIDNLPDEKGYGFVNADDMFDLDWHTSEKGHYVTFGFRVDVRKIPSIILKKHLNEMLKEERERLAAQGRKFISKDRKSELRELCKSRLLTKMEPRPSMSGVAIDMTTGLVYVASRPNPCLSSSNSISRRPSAANSNACTPLPWPPPVPIIPSGTSCVNSIRKA